MANRGPIGKPSRAIPLTDAAIAKLIRQFNKAPPPEVNRYVDVTSPQRDAAHDPEAEQIFREGKRRDF